MLLKYNSILGMPVDDSKNDDEPTTIEINPRMIIILALVIGLFIILFSSLGNGKSSTSTPSLTPNTPSSPSKPLKILEYIIGGVVILVIVLSGIQYFFNINLTARLTDFFSNEPNLDIIVKDTEPGSSTAPVPEIKLKKQVFHIPNNTFTYNNAKALCDAYGARLANYNEVEKAYRNGAEWCSYGWTQDQMALFPTQKKTWDKFGATCYGYRPKITEEEAELMENTPIYPKSMTDIRFNKQVDYWKQRIPNILVAPFNRNLWSFI